MADLPMKRIASVAALGLAGTLAAAATVVGTMAGQGYYAKKSIGVRRNSAPYADGLYGANLPGTSLRYVMIGDSTGAGLGANSPLDTPGAVIAQGLVDASGRPVRYINMAVVGAQSLGLEQQVERAQLVKPHVVTIMIGGNDITHLVPVKQAARALGEDIGKLVDSGAEVVVGTCPDLATIQPFMEPLRSFAGLKSKQLAKLQAIATIEAGGRAVSLGDLLGPVFGSLPTEMFADDRFHPSSEGYSKVAQVLLPSVLDSMGLLPEDEAGFDHPGEDEVMSAEAAAEVAGEGAGTEMAPLEDGDQPNVGRTKWAHTLRRVLRPVRRADQPAPLMQDDFYVQDDRDGDAPAENNSEVAHIE